MYGEVKKWLNYFRRRTVATTDKALSDSAARAETIPPIKLDFRNSRATADPYLVWANATEFREFAIDPGGQENPYIQVALECTKNPQTVKGEDDEWPYLGLRDIALSQQDGKLFCTGIVKQSDLAALLPYGVLELNVPRYKRDSYAAGGATKEATPAALGKRVMAVIDFGCPFAHRQFWDDWNATTRVRYFWDQDACRTIAGKDDKDGDDAAIKNKYWFINKLFRYGRETTSEELKPLFRRCMHSGVIDEDLAYELADYPEMQAPTSHGAHVLDLAAGRINPTSGREDEASEADIIFVQLPRAAVEDTSGGSMTMYVLDALKYIFEKTPDVEHLVINMSFGSTAGPHDGTSMLERGIDALIRQERVKRAGRTIELVLPAGNHFLADLHGNVTLTQQDNKGVFHWEIMPDDTTETFLELWCPAHTALEVALTSPTDASLKMLSSETEKFDTDKTMGLVRTTGSALGKGEVVLVVLAPTCPQALKTVCSGVWTVSVSATVQASQEILVNAWIERDDPMPWQSGQPQCRLLSSTLSRDINALDVPTDAVKRAQTGNSLAYGETPIVVGGYVVSSAVSSYPGDVVMSEFSAAGNFENARAYIAPSDETDALEGIWAASNRSDTLAKMNGTSVAAPQVARQLLNSPDKRRLRYPISPRPLGDMRDLRGAVLPQVY